MTAMLSPILPLMTPPTQSPKAQTRKRPRYAVEAIQEQTMDTFLTELQELFERPLTTERLATCSDRLQQEYKDRLKKSKISMLPSYNHTLPTGDETGDCLALDVGGSTLRVALIRLSGRATETSMHIRGLRSYDIDESIKRLHGQAFFHWMADRIGDMLSECSTDVDTTRDLPMGLAWSFPIEQTSSRSGRLLAMGKDFYADQGLENQDLSEIVMRSCKAAKLRVQMRAIVNDSAATLLSQAYLDSAARMSLILGTGMNSSVFLPVTAVAAEKFGVRPQSWHDRARHVLVNTELSMFGKGIVPTTRWDEQLNAAHKQPDYQPMEYLVTGMYLGEIVRLILLEAINKVGLFNGECPAKFTQQYSLSTKTIAVFESDNDSNLSKACTTFLRQHRLTTKPSRSELLFVRSVVKLVSHRAQAYLATAIHALWALRTEAEDLQVGDQHITVACNGTVIEKYPGFLSNCQQHLDALCVASGAAADIITLQMAIDSSILGAAVAVSCIKDP